MRIDPSRYPPVSRGGKGRCPDCNHGHSDDAVAGEQDEHDARSAQYESRDVYHLLQVEAVMGGQDAGEGAGDRGVVDVDG